MSITTNITIDQGATSSLYYSTPVPIPGWARWTIKANLSVATPELTIWSTPVITGSNTSINMQIPPYSTFVLQRQNYYDLDITDLAATPRVTRVQKGKLFVDRT